MTRRAWILVLGLYALVGLAFYSYTLLNAIPGPDRWPAYYAWDPGTHALVQPLTGDGAYQTFVLKSWLDASMPFVPLLALPYVTYLLLGPIIVPALVLIYGSLRQFATVMLALVASQLVLDLGYFLFQTNVPRTATPPEGFNGWLIELVWGNDLPFNGFPSAHCAWTTVAIIALWRLRHRLPWVSWPLMGWLALVYPATVMLQQHFLIDVYAGIPIGFAAYWAVMFLVERPVLAERGA